MAEELEKFDSIQVRDFPEKDIFAIDSRVRNSDIVTAGIFGVLLFLPGWFALKVLDDLYEVKIKPKIQDIIKKADEIEIFKSSKKYFVHSLSIYHEELNVLARLMRHPL